jgi:ferrochelatase
MRTEANFIHGAQLRTAVVLVNLGTPEAAETGAVRRYLREFLSDPRVIEIPRLVWWPILHGIILRLRPRRSAHKYASVWTADGSPLLAIGRAQAAALQASLSAAGRDLSVRLAMRYGQPSVASVLDELRADGHDRILILPLYPQYAAATVASVYDAVGDWLRPVRNVPELRFVKHFHDHPAYIDALARIVEAHWQAVGRPDFAQGDVLLMSFHGVPQATLDRGDPYHCECRKTARLLGERLGLAPPAYQVAFQSRFGKAQWLQPSTDSLLKSLPAQGARRLDVLCPGFMADCLETLEEIDQEGRQTFLTAGGQDFHYIPCVNSTPVAIRLLADLVETHTAGWPDISPTKKMPSSP